MGGGEGEGEGGVSRFSGNFMKMGDLGRGSGGRYWREFGDGGEFLRWIVGTEPGVSRKWVVLGFMGMACRKFVRFGWDRFFLSILRIFSRRYLSRVEDRNSK